MATVETARSQDKSSKKNVFSSWIKKMTSLKSSSGSKRSKKPRNASPAASEKVPIVNGAGHDETSAMQRIPSNGIERHPVMGTSEDQRATGSFMSLPVNEDGQQQRDESNKSAAPTLATNPDTINSDTAQSKSCMSNGAGGAGISSHSGGAGSIFSSSNHSARSLTTTLTTIQSTAPSGHFQPNAATNASTPAQGGHSSHPSQGSTYFSHQYPTTPASAVPTHLQPLNPSHQPTTYRSATANNFLSDNASILTLASSSHNNNNRRNSLDTAASIRAIAPSSQWGGSRESLPLSTFSQNTEAQGATIAGPAPHLGSNRTPIGFPNTERASLISSHGVTAPALSSERNSVYRGVDGSSLRAADRAGDGASLRGRDGTDGSSLRGNDRDGASMRSGLAGHGRNDSLAGSVTGFGSPLASPKIGESSQAVAES